MSEGRETEYLAAVVHAAKGEVARRMEALPPPGIALGGIVVICDRSGVRTVDTGGLPIDVGAALGGLVADREVRACAWLRYDADVDELGTARSERLRIDARSGARSSTEVAPIERTADGLPTWREWRLLR